MKTFDDGTGLRVTGASAESAASFRTVMQSYLTYDRGLAGQLKALHQSDPDMPMARCIGGYFAKLMGSKAHSERAHGIVAGLRDTIARVGATERERGHAAALAAWSQGDMDGATDAWEAILLDHPTDMLALRLAHFAHFYSGDGRRLRDSVARVLPRWSEAHSDFGFVQGMYAFGLEEAGDYARAEEYGRAAVARNPGDAWSIHAVAHVLEMTERHEDGIAWVNGLEPHWSQINNFRFHLYWHRALFHLERGEFDAVLQLYDGQIASDIGADFYLDLCNAASLLWRLEMFGIDVGNRWGPLAEISRNHLEDRDLIFVSLHHLMALSASGDQSGMERILETIRGWPALGDTQARVCADCGVALAEGLALARAGDHAAALRHITPIRYKIDAIGGSLAQRDVFHMILLDTAKASEDALQARALFAERLGHKMHSAWTWRNYGGLLQATGDADGSVEALARANALLS